MKLERSAHDRKTFLLDGVGELRKHGWFSSAATLSDGAREWEIGRRGLRQRVHITDATGGEPATYEPKGVFSRGGTLTMGGQTWELRPSSIWKERYALVQGEQEVATVEASSWSSKKPVTVELEGEVDAMVLLAACYLVKLSSDDSSASTASVSAGA